MYIGMYVIYRGAKGKRYGRGKNSELFIAHECVH